MENLYDDNGAELRLESRRFSTNTEILETKLQSASLNLNTIIRYIESPIDMQLKFLCISVQKYTQQHNNDPEKMKVIDTYFVSELSRIILAAKEKLRTERQTLNASLRLSRYGNEITRVGNLLNLQFKKAEKYQNKSGYIPKQIQLEINELFTAFVKHFKSKYIESKDTTDEMDAAVVTQSDTGKKNRLTIKLDLKKVDPDSHFEQVDSILDKHQIGIYQIHDKLTNLGTYDIEFLDKVDPRVINKIQSEINNLSLK